MIETVLLSCERMANSGQYSVVGNNTIHFFTAHRIPNTEY
jgi:hypothetical protein